MGLLTEISEMKETLQAAADKRAREEGTLAERKRVLKELCGTDDTKKARKKLEVMEAANEEATLDYDKALTEFEEKYADLLN